MHLWISVFLCKSMSENKSCDRIGVFLYLICITMWSKKLFEDKGMRCSGLLNKLHLVNLELQV